MTAEAIFEPLALGPLTARNRVLARASPGASTSTTARDAGACQLGPPLRSRRRRRDHLVGRLVHPRGAIVPGYAHRLRRVDPVLAGARKARARGEAARTSSRSSMRAASGSCPSRSGTKKTLSSSSKPEPLNGFPAEAMTVEEIGEVVELFARAARRAKEAGSTASRWPARTGCSRRSSSPRRSTTATTPTAGRSRTAPASGSGSSAQIREAVGPEFCVGYRSRSRSASTKLMPWLPRGNTLEESLQMCRWLEEAGADYLHVSAGGFPHPRNPAGPFPPRKW